MRQLNYEVIKEYFFLLCVVSVDDDGLGVCACFDTLLPLGIIR